MSEWRIVERPSALSVQPRAQVEGDIPDVHIITVRERRVTVDYPTIIQNNVNTDTIELDLDGEWDGMSVVLVLGPCGEATELAWHGSPLTLPPALAEDTGGIDVSVVGYSADGLTRLVTVAAPSLLNVIKSGCTVGEAPDDDTPDLIGQLVAAGDAANQAAQAANTAAGKANTAATAATNAAGTANTAASAANTAADKAKSAATSATNAAGTASDAAEGATQAAQSANAAAEAASAAAEAARGNVLKGTLGPDPLLSADDAYATTPRRLTVYGETRQNLWVNPKWTLDGVTVTPNADGSVTLSGTNTSNDIWIGYARRYVLKPGSTYTLSVDKALPSSIAFSVEPRDAGGNVISPGSITVRSGVTTKTATVPSNTAYVNMLIVITANVGTTISGTYRVMLNEGSTAQPWCPPGLNSVDELSVVCAGKNLLARMGPELPSVMAGITFSDNGDGGIRVSGTATTAAYYDLFDKAAQKTVICPAGTYTASLAGRVNGTGLIVGFFNDGASGAYTSWISDGSSEPATGTLSSPKYLRPFLSVASGTTVDVVVYPQLELGSTATAYEPPNVTTTPIDLDGNSLRSLPDGTCDELVIEQDGSAYIEKKVGKSLVTSDSTGQLGDAVGTMRRFNFSCVSDGNAYPSLFANIKNGWCDKLSYRFDNHDTGYPYAFMSASNGMVGFILNETDLSGADNFVDSIAPVSVFYPLAVPKTIPLPNIGLPVLPAPTANVYANAEAFDTGYAMAPDVGMEYERDVNIAYEQLEARISALSVAQATS